MVTRRWLFGASALLWFFASSRILPKGISSVIVDHRILVVVVMIIVLAFFVTMFGKVSKSYCNRIKNLEGERFPLYRFMSLKGYLVIGFMMSLGISLSLIPGVPVATFACIYPGLGLGLFSGAVRFLTEGVTWKELDVK